MRSEETQHPDQDEPENGEPDDEDQASTERAEGSGHAEGTPQVGESERTEQGAADHGKPNDVEGPQGSSRD